jgi:hypothetical protein
VKRIVLTALSLIFLALTARAEFPRETCDRLYQAILVHDNIYPGVNPPKAIKIEYKKGQLEKFYELSEQLWRTGFDRTRLKETIEKLSAGGTLSPADAEYYKSVRAKFKQLRFAYAAFGASHEYPKRFDKLTAAMGHFSDALKNGDREMMLEKKELVLDLLGKKNMKKIQEELAEFRPSNKDSFAAYVIDEVHELKELAQQPKVTSKQFHEMRKVISRQVAIFDTIQTFDPSPYHLQIVQYLSTLNGKMGSMHDELVKKSFSKSLDYRKDLIEVPSDIREGLLKLVDRY